MPEAGSGTPAMPYTDPKSALGLSFMGEHITASPNQPVLRSLVTVEALLQWGT
jgi:hypothetical protein